MMATAFHPAGWTEMKSRLNVALGLSGERRGKMEELIVKIAAELAEWRGLAIVWGELVEALLTAGTFTIASVAIFEWGDLL
jgi:hypothetical protein